jgi:hypothetical protein
MRYVTYVTELALNRARIAPYARLAEGLAKLRAHKVFSRLVQHAAIAGEKEASFLIPVKSAADMEGYGKRRESR